MGFSSAVKIIENSGELKFVQIVSRIWSIYFVLLRVKDTWKSLTILPFHCNLCSIPVVVNYELFYILDLLKVVVALLGIQSFIGEWLFVYFFVLKGFLRLEIISAIISGFYFFRDLLRKILNLRGLNFFLLNWSIYFLPLFLLSDWPIFSCLLFGCRSSSSSLLFSPSCFLLRIILLLPHWLDQGLDLLSSFRLLFPTFFCLSLFLSILFFLFFLHLSLLFPFLPK